MILNKNIKTIRETWKMTQQAFATLLEVSRGNIANYESDENRPSLEFLLKLEETTGIPFRDLCLKSIMSVEVPERPFRHGEGVGLLGRGVGINMPITHNGIGDQNVGVGELEALKLRVSELEKTNSDKRTRRAPQRL